MGQPPDHCQRSPWHHRLDQGRESLLYVREYHGQDRDARLLLLHGIGDWGEDLAHFADSLNSDGRFWAPDLRGHGFSQRHSAYRLPDYVGDIADLVTRLNQPLVIYGHSLGGLIGLYVAHQLPDLVQAVICEDPPIFHLEQSIRERPAVLAAFQATRDLLQQGLDPAQLLRHLVQEAPQRDLPALRSRAQQWLRMDPRVWDPVVADALCRDLALPQLRCPLSILAADSSRGAAMLEDDEALARRISKQCTITRCPGAGHQLRKSHSAVAREVIEAALSA